jgi:hypothetical protein
MRHRRAAEVTCGERRRVVFGTVQTRRGVNAASMSQASKWMYALNWQP